MIEFTGHLDVEHPPPVVFELIADMSQLSKWNPNVTLSQRVSGERFEVGSRYESTIVRWPVRMTAKSELVEVERDSRVQYEGSIGAFWSIDSLTFSQLGAGTRITFHNVSRGPWWLKPLIPLMNRAFQGQAQRAVDGAADYLQGSEKE